MSIGTNANTFFSDRAPWAKVETAPEEAKQTIAHTALYIATLGVALAPYLPTLSANLLAYFPAMSDQCKKRIYSGDLLALKEHFAGTICLQKEPMATVPKLDDKLIAALEAELAEK